MCPPCSTFCRELLLSAAVAAAGVSAAEAAASTASASVEGEPPAAAMPEAGWWYNFNDSMFEHLSEADIQLLHEEMIANWSHTINDPAFDILRSPVWRGLVITLYIVVIVVGLVGNVIVICVVIRNRSMQNVTNILE